MKFEDLFDSFATDAFRFEALAEYRVDEERDAYARFLEDGDVDLEVNAEWCEFVSGVVARGGQVRRLRALTSPPSDYERFEIAVYAGNASAGEQIRLIERPTAVPPDFWLFDGRWLAVMNYSTTGEWRSADVIDLSVDAAPFELAPWMDAFESAQPLSSAQGHFDTL